MVVELPRAEAARSLAGKWKCLIELAEQAAATGNEDVLRVLRVLVAHNALVLGAVVQVRALCAFSKSRPDNSCGACIATNSRW